MRLLKDDEDLTWSDLGRRLRRTFPDLSAMWSVYSEWSTQKQYYEELYRRLDINVKTTKADYIAAAKSAKKRWKEKH